jgi:thiol-disulfide isomerase/thioredoxin
MKNKIVTILYLAFILLPLNLFSSAIFDMLPENLSNINNTPKNTHSIIAGKNYLAFYFVSLSNPNSKDFTSQVLNFYQTIGKENKVEIILVNMDKNTKDFQSNLKEYSIPWYIINYNTKAQQNISSFYGISKTPYLLIFDGFGKLITSQSSKKIYKKGSIFIEVNEDNHSTKTTLNQQLLQEDNNKDNSKKTSINKDDDKADDDDEEDDGDEKEVKSKKKSTRKSSKKTAKDKEEKEDENPPAILDILPEKLLKGKRKELSSLKALKNKKYIGLYFSAHWCGPCRHFTPQLVKFYRKVANKHKLEIIFVSSDRNVDEMKKYISEAKMPWCVIPFDARERLALKKKYRVNGIPRLIILESDGKVVSNNARFDVVKHNEDAVNYWQSNNYQPTTYNEVYSSSNNNKNSYSKKKSRRRK